jgi:hypothetical protein
MVPSEDEGSQNAPSDVPDGTREQITAAIQEALLEAESAADQALQALESIFSGLNTFDLLGWYTLSQLSVDPETYSEPLHEGSAAKVEYVMLQALRLGYNHGERRPPEPQEWTDFIDAVDAISRIPFLRELATASAAAPESGGDGAMLSHIVRSHEASVRSPGYPVHQERLLRELFTPFADELKASLGIGLEDIISTSSALSTLVDTRLHARKVAVAGAVRSARAAVEAVRRGKTVADDSPLPHEVTVSWAAMSNNDLDKAFAAMMGLGVGIGVGEEFLINVQSVADSTSLAPDTVAAFFDAFSLAFGSVGQEFARPQTLHPLRTRPLIKHGEFVFAGLAGSLIWAIQPRLEEVVKHTAPGRYGKHRHVATLALTKQCLLTVLKGATAVENAFYPGGPGGEEAELDLLVSYDSACFLVEVKAGSLRPISRKGVREPLHDQLNDLIRDSHQQAARALAYIQGSASAVLRGTNEFVADPARYTRFFMLTVLLEPLGHVYGALDSRSPLLTTVVGAPWVISILDLMVIADCLENYGPWLPLYIERRIRVLELAKVRTPDELDLFMYFLKRGLYFEDDPHHEEYDVIHLGTHTDPLDWYYFRAQGIRHGAAPKPKPDVDAGTLLFTEHLKRSGCQHWLDGSLALLSLSSQARAQFIDRVRQIKKRTQKDRRSHDFSLHAEPGGHGGITYVCEPDGSDAERMARYAERKRRELHLREWVLIADVDRRKVSIAYIVVCNATRTVIGHS